jgi:hypothetical protein
MQAKFVNEAIDPKTKLLNRVLKRITLINQSFVHSFNIKSRKKWETYLKDYEGDVIRTRANVAFDFIWEVAKLVGLYPSQGDWMNREKDPVNHFQYECWASLDPPGDLAFYQLDGMIYVDNNNQVNLYYTRIKLYDDDYNEVIGLIETNHEAYYNYQDTIYEKKYQSFSKNNRWFWYDFVKKFNEKTQRNLKKLTKLDKGEVEFSLTQDLVYLICKKIGVDVIPSEIKWDNEERYKKYDSSFNGIEFKIEKNIDDVPIQIDGNIYFGRDFEIYISGSEFKILHYGWHILFEPKKD